MKISVKNEEENIKLSFNKKENHHQAELDLGEFNNTHLGDLKERVINDILVKSQKFYDLRNYNKDTRFSYDITSNFHKLFPSKGKYINFIVINFDGSVNIRIDYFQDNLNLSLPVDVHLNDLSIEVVVAIKQTLNSRIEKLTKDNL